MRGVWIAFAAILGASLLGAFLLWRALDETNEAKPLLAPRGARVLAVQPLGTRRIVTWRLGGHAEEPSTGLYGLTIWQGRRRLHEYRAEPNATGIRVETGDFGGDGHGDLLLFEDHDGNGSCGLYRALVSTPASIRPVKSRLLCADQGSIHLERRGLVFRIGGRTSVSRWNGHRLVVVSRSPG